MLDGPESMECDPQADDLDGCRYEPGEMCLLRSNGHKVKPIGALSGNWSLLFKIYMIAAPVVAFMITVVGLPWVRWVTENQYDRESRLQATQVSIDRLGESLKQVASELKDSRQLHDRDISQLHTAIAALPPEAWRERIITLEGQAKEQQGAMTRVLVNLEQIKFKLGISKEDGGT